MTNFDSYVHGLLKDSGITPEYGQMSASGLQAVVGEFLLIIENRPERGKLCLRDDSGKISENAEAVRDYAVNSAVSCAKKILASGSYKKIFAFGNAGTSRHHTMKPVFVAEGIVKELSEVETFGNFSPENIGKYYAHEVMGLKPSEERELDDIEKIEGELHEYLRNYGNLGEHENPLAVSALLLALMEKKHGFSISELTGDSVNTDGKKLYGYIEDSLRHASVPPGVELTRIKEQFTFIKNRPILNTVRADLKMTPLKFFADFIDQKVYRNFSSSEDYIGRFYTEFIRYTGGNAQSLGVVITPRHITELFCDLVDLKADDVIFDPCCGTGGFLIAGMHRMLQLATNDQQRERIRTEQIHGIELRDDMFSMATASMILHGDGQSNITCEDFLKSDISTLRNKGITVGFMNPPYSQAKTSKTANLSELAFTIRLLRSVTPGGRAAVIVPVSAMIGKTKEDRKIKSEILKEHTLEGVISLNKDTFYGVGTVPCIAVFTAGQPHAQGKLVKFINFQDDGYIVKMHTNKISPTERARDRKQYLLECWRGKIKDAPSDFMVETEIEEGDEWLHSFYYYNDEIPDEKDFADSLADYLAFEFDMIVHGRGYLFDEDGK